ncbi:succinyldiaminopimelate transaminase, partial [Streptomyces ipomoeae 91-03]
PPCHAPCRSHCGQAEGARGSNPGPLRRCTEPQPSGLFVGSFGRDPPLVTESVARPPFVAPLVASPRASPAEPAAAPAVFCATGVVFLTAFPPVLLTVGRVSLAVLPPTLLATPVTFCVAPSTVLPAFVPSTADRPPRFGVAGSSGAALAEPAAPTTEAAPAAVSSAVRAIRRVRGRDMVLL